jgi:hypothetical protein
MARHHDALAVARPTASPRRCSAATCGGGSLCVCASTPTSRRPTSGPSTFWCSTSWKFRTSRSIGESPWWPTPTCALTPPSFPTTFAGLSSSWLPMSFSLATFRPRTSCELTTCASTRNRGPSTASSGPPVPSLPFRVVRRLSPLLPARGRRPCRQDCGHLIASRASSSVVPSWSPINRFRPRARSMDRMASDVNIDFVTGGADSVQSCGATSRDTFPRPRSIHAWRSPK